MPLDTNFQTTLIAENQGDLLLLTSFVAAAVNIAAVYLLVKRFGSLGAAVALIITNLSRVVILGTICKYYYDRPASILWGRFAIIVIGAVFCHCVMRGTTFANGGLTGLGTKGLVLTIYCLATWLIAFSVDLGSLRNFRIR